MNPAPSIAAHAEAERALLACILHAPDTLADVADVVEPGDFGDPRAGALWTAALDALRRGAPVSAATLTAAAPELAELVEAAFAGWCGSDVAHARHFARLIRDRAQRRRLLRAIEGAARAVVDGDDSDAGALTDGALAAILAATTDRETPDASDARTLCAAAWRAATDRTPPDVVTTGFVDLDHALGGGLAPGAVHTIGARTSVGKTALAVAIARAAAAAGARVLFASLEARRAEIADRLLAQLSGVALRDIRARQLKADELRRLADVQNEIADWGSRLEIVDRGVRTVEALAGLLRRRAAMGRPVRLLILDYFQAMQLPRGAALREGLSQVSRELAALAKDSGAALVLLAQLKREAEGRPDGSGRRLLPPCLGDLQETSALEQDADAVGLLWREADDGPLRLELAKNRCGEPGLTVFLAWHGPTATPRSLAMSEAVSAARGRRS